MNSLLVVWGPQLFLHFPSVWKQFESLLSFKQTKLQWFYFETAVHVIKFIIKHDDE